jgi:hypothetical protein
MLRMLTGSGLLTVMVLLAAGIPVQAEPVSLGAITVYGPDEIREYVSGRAGSACLAFPGTRRWMLTGDADDYCSMPTDEVVKALEAIDFPIELMTVHVLILPVPRRDLPKSSAEGNIVFLCPGRVPYPVEHIHYTVTHEIGHVVQHLLMPDSRHDLWNEYTHLRGLDGWSHRDPADHASNLHEIFAEDFRVLFGGEQALCGGEVENHYIGSPSDVSGLKTFILDLLDRGGRRSRLAAYPNPFEINMVLSAMSLDEADCIKGIDVYDVGGRLVRSMRFPGPGAVEVVWDGRADDGGTAAPGLYFISATTTDNMYVCKVAKIAR